MAIDMSQFYQVFFEESAEHLAAMESLLLELDVDNPDPEQLNAIFRAAHSIKGSAGTFGFTDLAETTHVLESLLDRIRKQELGVRPEIVDACLQCGDLLKGMLGAHQGQGAVDVAAVQANGARLRELATDRAADQPATEQQASPAAPKTADVAPTSQRVFAIQFVPTEVSAMGDGVNNLIEELKLLGQVAIVRQPDTGVHSVGFWEVRLSSDFGQEAFADQIDFIADNGAWRVLESAPEGEPDEKPFGIFADAPGAPVEEAAYGLFDPSEYADDSGTSSATADNEAYGFFEPLPPVAAFTAAADDSYGFFEPLPMPVAVVQPTSEATAAIPGDPGGSAGAKIAVAEKPPAGTRSRQPRSVSDASIRVSVEKVDQLINLVGELVITQAMLLQTAGQMQDSAPEHLLNGLTQLERNTRDLQESVLSIRMLPISFVFSRFPRVVRDLSGKLGKQVELKTSGETTELDKGLIERIADPLTHLIRNSLDHGIESPEQRVAAGKSPVGTITLKAYHQGGNVVIEVGDDGAGLPRDRILAKARERGLPVADQMSDQDVFALIFEAGFSTAEQVTDVSGRGVGMDVVRRNIQSMGGRVEIDSMPGIGTRITVRLPLTLAILDGMSIAVGEQTYIMPLSYVVESFQPRPGEVKTLSNQARVIQIRGDYLPVLALHEVFNIASAADDFTQGIMVVVDADGTKAALFVDALLGQHQVVIKSLEANFRRVHGISGATIMGDGRVALILDLAAIAGLARSSVQKAG